MYVQYGCGQHAPETWRNFDSSPTLRLQRIPIIGSRFSGGRFPVFPPNVEYGDIVEGLPVGQQSCQAIYCAHVLEHLTLEDCRAALRNTFRHLKPGGTFRLVVPDLQQIASDYVQSDGSYAFMEILQLGRTSRPHSLEGFAREWLGNGHHLWMWDFTSLNRELQEAGFWDIRRAEYGDASEQRFKEVELEDRWACCLGIECRRA